MEKREVSATLEIYFLLLKPLHYGADVWASISAGTQRCRKRELYLQVEEALEDSNTAMRVRSERVKSLDRRTSTVSMQNQQTRP